MDKCKTHTQNINSYVDTLGYSNLSPNMNSHIYKWHKMGYKLISPDMWSYRLSKCRTCKFWSETKHSQYMRCSKCNCSSEGMVLKSSHCPLNESKW